MTPTPPEPQAGGAAGAGRRDGRIPGFVPVAVTIAATQFAWTSMIPVLPSRALEIGADTAGIGVVVAAFGLGRLLMDVPAGLFAGRAPVAVLLTTGAVGVAAATAAAGTADSLWWLLVARVAMGATTALALTSGTALVARLTESARRGRVVARLQLYQLAATTAGPLAGGFVAGRAGTRTALLAAGVVGASVAAAALPWLPVRQRLRSPGEPAAPAAAVPVQRRSPTVVLVLASSVAAAIFVARFAGEQTLVPVIALELGWSVTRLGVLLAGMSVLQGIGVIVNGPIYDRFEKRTVVAVTAGAMGACLGLLALAGTGVALVTVALTLGLFQGAVVPASSAYLLDAVDSARVGFSVGVYRSFGDLAAVLGPPATSALAATVGFGAAALVLSALVLGIAVTFGLTAVQVRPAPATGGRDEPP